ncbi:MAG: flagellar biosynthesis protein FlhA [Pseudomonadota bacterium]
MLSTTKKGWITGGYSDLVLAGGVLLIMGLMVMRLPTSVIDGLVAVNIAMGIGLLLIAIYVPSPVMFNSFPSVLLISTLFRLSLSVATTRLILLEADAGNIIQAFGSFVAGGNLVVGIVIFAIITVIQFIVIAKGAERVAEVSARFTLDAMPGKQMSIDSDLRSGLIEKEEAKRRRTLLEKESQLNGALDGAMKFVKGDAIASIVIVLINLVGGLTIGVMQRGLDFGTALSSYSILTIGDGMVAQIPALLGAMAAGLVVTRTTSDEDNLGETIGRQLGSQPKAIMVTGVISLLLALVPGFPSSVFLCLSALLFLVTYQSAPQKLNVLLAKVRGQTPVDVLENPSPDAGGLSFFAEPLVFELPTRYANRQVDIVRMLDETKQIISDELGVPMPEPILKWIGAESKPRILIYEIAVELKVEEFDEAADELGNIRICFERSMRLHAGEFLGVQEVSEILDSATRAFPALVREVTRHVANQQLADVLRQLVQENIPIRNLRDILQALAEWGPKEKTSAGLTEFARVGLNRYITARFTKEDGNIHAVTISPQTEAELRASLKETITGVVLTLAPDQVNRIRTDLINELNNTESDPVVLTAIDLRRHVRNIISVQAPMTSVLSFQELLPTVSVLPVAEITS